MPPTTGRTLCLVLYLTLSSGVLCLAGPTAQTRPAVSIGRTRSAVSRAQTRPVAPAARIKPAASAAQTRPAVSVVQTKPAGQTPVKLPEARAVSFATKDNLMIAGTYTPPPRKADRAPMVILLHMYASDGAAFDPLVPRLHAAGLAVLAIDLRGHGKSIGPPELGLADQVAQRDKKLFAAMDRDVEGAYAWLSKQPGVDPARFVLVGASVGCSVALRYAARDRSVDGIVCLTPGTAYMGLDSLSDARKYGRRPLLLVASENERSACDDLGRIVPEAVVQIVPSPSGAEKMALHGTRLFGQAGGIEQAITVFLLKAAGPPPREPVLASLNGEVYHPFTGRGTGQISPGNTRWFSSAEEAEARGLRPAKTRSTRGRSRGATTGGEPFPGSERAAGAGR